MHKKDQKSLTAAGPVLSSVFYAPFLACLEFTQEERQQAIFNLLSVSSSQYPCVASGSAVMWHQPLLSDTSRWSKVTVFYKFGCSCCWPSACWHLTSKSVAIRRRHLSLQVGSRHKVSGYFILLSNCRTPDLADSSLTPLLFPASNPNVPFRCGRCQCAQEPCLGLPLEASSRSCRSLFTRCAGGARRRRRVASSGTPQRSSSNQDP